MFDRPARKSADAGSDPETDDPIRQAYYAPQQGVLGCAEPLESCLTEDPLQVMLSGKVQPMREAEATLRAAPFAEEYPPCGHRLREPRFRDDRRRFILTARKARRWRNGRPFADMSASEVMAIGDNHNDLEMLSFAGIPVVMGNGVPELKNFGWHETGNQRRKRRGCRDRTVRTARGGLMRVNYLPLCTRHCCCRAFDGLAPQRTPNISCCEAGNGSTLAAISLLERQVSIADGGRFCGDWQRRTLRHRA